MQHRIVIRSLNSSSPSSVPIVGDLLFIALLFLLYTDKLHKTHCMLLFDVLYMQIAREMEMCKTIIVASFSTLQRQTH